jgi:SulP family sulfate permease
MVRLPSFRRYMPRLFQILASEKYTAATFLGDLSAGITVGLVALPLAMAFGIASGVKPEQGIYTAIIAGLVMSLFGGSRVQIGGPTGAFVIVIAGIIGQFGLSGLWMVTSLAGLILLFMGFTGLGTMVKFIPRPIIIGFTNGIAILIAATQIKDFLGLPLNTVPSDFIPRLSVLLGHLNTIQLPTLLISLSSLAVIVLWPRFNKQIPAYIVAFLFGTILTTALGIPTETIGTRFGGIPTGLPHFVAPIIHFDMISILLPSAVTVALLSAIESLLSAVVADGLIEDRHDSNQELIGNGLANMFTPLVGGIPATGAIARTATNIRSGAKTPMSGIIHALTLLVIILVAAPLARFIPLATLSAILVAVAYKMGEWHEIRHILRLSKTDISVWAVTFLLTVFTNLTLAVEIGMVLAAMLYIYRVSQTTTVVSINNDFLQNNILHALEDKELPAYVSILRIQGPFLFGATDKLAATTVDLNQFRAIVILRLRDMTAIDATGLHAIAVFAKRLQASGRVLLLCGANTQPEKILKHSTILRYISNQNVLPHITAALSRAKQIQEEEGVETHEHSV